MAPAIYIFSHIMRLYACLFRLEPAVHDKSVRLL